MKHYRLKLYITGRTARSELAIRNLEAILAGCGDDQRYEFTVIDLMENPELAEREKILATPTLVKELPPPARRIIGDLSLHERVYIALDMAPKPPSPGA